MPIQSGINPTNTANQQPTGPVDKKTASAQAVGDASGSSPQTNVAIKNAVTDLSKVLSDIIGAQNINTDDLSPEIQKLVQQLLQDAFSIDKTLAQGLGDALQARRYAFDQLASLGKMLSQLGELMENGDYTGLPDNIKVLLNNFRSLLTQENQYPSMVDMSKTAFNLLNNKDDSELPETLQTLVKTQPADTAGAENTSNTGDKRAGVNDNVRLLKNILDTFFKSDAAAGGKGTGGKPSVDSPVQQAVSAKVINTGTAEDSGEKLQSARAKMGNDAGLAGTEKNTVPQYPSGGGRASTQPAAERPTVIQNGRVIAEDTAETAAAGQKISNAVDSAVSSAASEPPDMKNMLQQPFSVATKAAATQMTQGSNIPIQQEISVPDFMNNTAQSMSALRDLGQLLLQNKQLSSADTALLKDFVNGNQQILSPKDAEQLQKVMQVVEGNIPGVVSQAAARNNVPNLPKLWAFVQLSDISTINDADASSLKRAGENVSDFAKVMGQSFPTDSTSSAAQKSLDFILPIFLDERKSYPAYINVYNEGHRNSETGEEQYETWFRVCCLTENAGAVEIVLRLYNKQQLNVRLSFSSEDTAVSFENYLPELRSYLHESKLNLTELKIGTIE
ncbi:flagellar hook-length control protein FliK [Pectinatus haikarae]|uniref:flagellar hook-length control protein FliK n=1 Tax=Pectinatus haikarae TaxID=349096 RepID=UPI0018C5F5F6|nr:flagellar hook-length control protein FliK [Pectinatus haikarae]